MADETTTTTPDTAESPMLPAATSGAPIATDTLDEEALEESDGGYVVLVDGLTYYTDTEVRDRRGIPRRYRRRGRLGDVVELDDDQAERLARAGAVGDRDDLEAVRFLNAVRDRRPRERAEVLRRVSQGQALAEATLDVFGVDDVEEAADDAEAENAATAGELDENATRERLDAMSADDVRAEAAAMGHQVNSRTTKAEAVELIVAGPPPAEPTE